MTEYYSTVIIVSFSLLVVFCMFIFAGIFVEKYFYPKPKNSKNNHINNTDKIGLIHKIICYLPIIIIRIFLVSTSISLSFNFTSFFSLFSFLSRQISVYSYKV